MANDVPTGSLATRVTLLRSQPEGVIGKVR
jgi:hypothetical protein